MNAIKLSAPVGKSPRKGEGKPVKNNASDVELVRKMLNANGYPKLNINTKADGALFRLIGAFQKSIGIKEPDEIIDPGGRTFNALLPKYKVVLDKPPAEPPKDLPKLYEFSYLGRKYLITERDLKSARAAAIKALEPLVMGRVRMGVTYFQMYTKILERANIRNDFLDALVHSYIVPKGKIPKSKTATKAGNANNGLLVAYRSGDTANLSKALIEWEDAVPAFEAEIIEYHKELQAGALTAMKVIKVSRMVSFTILAAVAAPHLAAGSFLSTNSAIAVSAVTAKVIQSAAEELEKKAGGEKVTWSSGVMNVSLDGIIGTLTQGLLSKIDGSLITRMANRLAPEMARRLHGISEAQLNPFLREYLKGSGKEILKSGSEQVLNIMGDMAKTGRAPTAKMVEDGFKDTLYSALTSGLLKNLVDFEASWDGESQSVLTKTIMPDVMKKELGLVNLPSRVQNNIYNEVVAKVSDTALRYGYDEVLDLASGKESGKKLSGQVAKKMSADKAFRKLVKVELERAAKKHKVSVKS